MKSPPITGRKAVWILLALLVPSMASAVDVTYTAFDLAAGRIEVRSAMGERALRDGKFDTLMDGGICRVKVSAGAIMPISSGGEACAPLWRRKEPTKLSLMLPATDGDRVNVVLTPHSIDFQERSERFKVYGPKLDTVGVLSLGTAVAVYTPKGWVSFPAGGGGIVEVKEDLKGAESTVAFTKTDGSKRGYFLWKVDKGKGKIRASAGNETPNNHSANLDDKKGFCLDARKEFHGQYVVCFDATTPAARVELPPQGTILRPNRAIVVAIRHLHIHAPTIKVTGTRGLYTPGIRNQDLIGDLAARGDTTLRYVVTSQVYAPRKPGPMDIVITVAAGDEVFARGTAEMEIEATYAGAIRLGIGGVFGSAVDREYESRLQPGAQQPEVVAKGGGAFDYELLVGYAPFFERGGRGYSGTNWAHFAPYVGIGVLSVTGDGAFDALKSIHVGVEWEPTSNFSIALTGVVRRVTRLAGGVTVGSPVTGDVPTVTEPHFGLGVVINLSPDFFKIGASQATSFMP